MQLSPWHSSTRHINDCFASVVHAYTVTVLTPSQVELASRSPNMRSLLDEVLRMQLYVRTGIACVVSWIS